MVVYILYARGRVIRMNVVTQRFKGSGECRLLSVVGMLYGIVNGTR